MATLIYTEQAGDKLKLIAEVDEDNVELAVDALLDADPKFANQQPFVCFNSEARVVVEAEEEIVQPRRNIRINGGGAPKRQQRQTRKPRAKAVDDDGPDAPNKIDGRTKEGRAALAAARKAAGEKPKRGPGRPKGSGAKKQPAKPAAKRGPGRPKGSTKTKPKAAPKKAAAKKGGSPFKRNAASDE